MIYECGMMSLGDGESMGASCSEMAIRWDINGINKFVNLCVFVRVLACVSQGVNSFAKREAPAAY